mmetsp:Transcript_20019/g.28171  ORF Transcript_20019/g.28171 Transcript_20019/m.28171 type:complete len:330 (+) Transcript_20019:1851-2840(+)
MSNKNRRRIKPSNLFPKSGLNTEQLDIDDVNQAETLLAISGENGVSYFDSSSFYKNHDHAVTTTKKDTNKRQRTKSQGEDEGARPPLSDGNIENGESSLPETVSNCKKASNLALTPSNREQDIAFMTEIEWIKSKHEADNLLAEHAAVASTDRGEEVEKANIPSQSCRDSKVKGGNSCEVNTILGENEDGKSDGNHFEGRNSNNFKQVSSGIRRESKRKGGGYHRGNNKNNNNKNNLYASHQKSGTFEPFDYSTVGNIGLQNTNQGSASMSGNPFFTGVPMNKDIKGGSNGAESMKHTAKNNGRVKNSSGGERSKKKEGSRSFVYRNNR